MQNFISNLFFGYSTSSITNSSRVNQLLGFDDLVDVLKVAPTAEYTRISELAISTLDAGGDLQAVKKQIDHLKRNLRPVLFSGYRNTGHGDQDGTFDYNGVVQVDLDFKIQGGQKLAKEAFAAIKQLPYVLLASISPSGVGVKAMVATTSEIASNHKEVSAQVCAAVGSAIGVETSQFDTIGYASVCYGFMNPDMYVNYNAVQFAVVEVPNRTAERVASGEVKIIQLTSLPEEINARLKRSLERALVKAPTFNTPGIQAFAGSMSAWAIDFETGYDFLVANGYGQNLHNNNNKGLNSLRDLTRKNKTLSSWGSALSRVVEIKAPTVAVPDLVINQYLDEVSNSIEITNRLLVVSPTGSGKTTWVKGLVSIPRIMVVPTRVMVDQIANETNAAVFYGNNHRAKITDDFIVTTYASLSTLATKFKAEGLARFTLFLDEMHVFTSNASHSFQHQTLRESLAVIAGMKWIGLTATPLYNFSPELEPARTVTVARKVNPIKTYHTVGCEHAIFESVVLGVQASKDAGRKSLVFLNNTQDDGQYGSILVGLTELGISVASVNSQVANTDNDLFNEVTVDGDMENADVILATSLFKEGMSVRKGFGTEVDIHIVGTWHPMEIEQFSNRTRGVEILTAYIYKSSEALVSHTEAELDPNTCPIDIEWIRENTRAKSIEVAEAFTRLCEVTTVTVPNIKNIASRIESADSVYYTKETNTCESDTLLLSNQVYEKEKQIAAVRNDFRDTLMRGYNWIRGKNIYPSKQLSSEVADVIEQRVEDAAKRKETLFQERVDFFAAKGIDDVIEYMKECEAGTAPVAKTEVEKASHQVQVKLASICKAFGLTGGKLEKPAEILRKIGKSNAALSQMWNVVKMDRLLGTESNSIDYLAYSEIKEMYYDEWLANPDTKFSKSEMHDIVHTVLNDKYKSYFGELKKSASKSGIEFSSIFEIENTTMMGNVLDKTGSMVTKQIQAFKIIGLAFDQYQKIIGDVATVRATVSLEDRLAELKNKKNHKTVEPAPVAIIKDPKKPTTNMIDNTQYPKSAENPRNFAREFIANLSKSKAVAQEVIEESKPPVIKRLDKNEDVASKMIDVRSQIAARFAANKNKT